MDFEKLLPGIKKNISLKTFTSFKIGGKAKYFFVAREKNDLKKAIFFAKKFNLPFFILGAGTNILFSDKGFNGLIIKIENSKLKIKKENSDYKIFTEAGVLLSKLVLKALEIGATGLEWAIGIPGTVGGAIYNNAGAFGKSMAQIVKEVEVLKIFNQKEKTKFNIKKYKNKDCKFGYRESIFKKNKNLIILSAILKIKKGNKKEIKRKIMEYLNYRKNTQPLNFPSAGSIFKNPPNYSAAQLIEESGLKGKKIGNVKISEKHSNFIVNLGKGKAKDVKKLIDLAKTEVKNKFGITLKEEIEYIDF